MPEAVGSKVAVGEEVLLSCAVEVFGEPARIDHAPVPTDGVLAANGVVLVMQIVWSVPAFDVLGSARTMITTSLVEAAQGALLIVQRRV